MIDEKVLNLIEESRQRMHRQMDDLYDRKLEALNASIDDETVPNDVCLTMRGNAGFFKGKRPIAVILPDGSEIPAKTWKVVAHTILSDCIDDPNRCTRLMNLRGNIYGKERCIIGSNREQMDVPIKICDGLFFETTYDTETLLNVLMTRVLAVVGYDYSSIKIRFTTTRRKAETLRSQENNSSG